MKYLVLLFFISCGQNYQDQKKLSGTTISLSLNGNYRVILRPLNHHLSGWIPNGKSDLEIDAEKMKFTTWLDDSSSVTHRQFILKGSRCPEARDDSNQDGVIDILETLRASGKILISLDDNLETQLTTHERFPVGNFSYQQEIKLSIIEQDLRKPDQDLNDHVIKLKPKDPFTLENKVMIVLGVSEKRLLADSVQNLEGVSPQLSTPIVCGLIQRNNENQ